MIGITLSPRASLVTAEYVRSPEAITTESLDELVQFILGDTKRIGSLLPQGA